MALTKVSTDGVKDDAITKTKIPANQIEASELADNAVDTNAIANNAVTAGKLASGVQTTINNNADNRVITGSGTANTLNGESNVVINAGKLGIGLTNPAAPIHTHTGNATNYRAFSNTACGGSTGSDGLLLGIDSNANVNIWNFENTYMNFATNGTERMRIDSSGNVGIGMTPAAPLHVTGATADTLRLTNGGGTSVYYKIGRNHLDGKLEFRGTQSGDECYSFGGVSGEKIRFQPAGGISFNGDTAAANALDDYEEGTWTPGLAFGGSSSATGLSYGNRSGVYTKIGNLVYIKAHFLISNAGSSTGHARITGLPFQSAGSPNAFVPLADRGTVNLGASGGTGSIGMAMYLDTNSSPYLYGYKFNGAGNFGVLQSSFTTNSEIDINFVYRAS